MREVISLILMRRLLAAFVACQRLISSLRRVSTFSMIMHGVTSAWCLHILCSTCVYYLYWLPSLKVNQDEPRIYCILYVPRPHRVFTAYVMQEGEVNWSPNRLLKLLNYNSTFKCSKNMRDVWWSTKGNCTKYINWYNHELMFLLFVVYICLAIYINYYPTMWFWPLLGTTWILASYTLDINKPCVGIWISCELMQCMWFYFVSCFYCSKWVYLLSICTLL